MADKNLVDGLRVSDMIVNGKCEDCILGHQTRRPFDGMTKKDMDPLDPACLTFGGHLESNLVGGNPT